MILALNLHKAWARRGRNYSTLEADTGIPRRTLGRILAQKDTPLAQAEYAPSYDTKKKLCGFFKVDMSLLNTRLPSAMIP